MRHILPKSFFKHSDLAKREWVAIELQKVRKKEEFLRRLSQSLQRGDFNPIDYERPDLEQMIDHEAKNKK